MGAIARTQPQTTAVARHDPLATPLGQMIAPYEAQLAPFLRNGVTLERVAAELVLMNQPKLLDCPAEKLVAAVCRALDTGGVIGTDVYLVPFRDTKAGVTLPTLMLDYKFKAQMVVAAGGCRSLQAEVVYSDDVFRLTLGSEPRVHHEPALTPKSGRKIIGVYAIAHMGIRSAAIIKWMSLAEVEVIRKRSREWNADKVRDCPAWYMRKSAIHQLCKLLPSKPELRAIMAQIEEEEAVEFGDNDDVAVTLERPDTVDENGVDLTYDDEFPEALPNDGTVRHVDADIAAALAYPMPGKPESWGGYGGKPLGECPLSVLTGAREWAIRQGEKERGYAKADVLEHMCTVAIEHLAKQEQEEAAVSESAEVFGEGHLGAVLPGEVEASRAEAGELPLGDTRPSRSRNAIAEGR